MSISNAVLAQKIVDLIDQWRNRELEFQAWMAGTPTGGPNSDGQYVLTDYLGATRLTKSPARLEADVQGLVDSSLAHRNDAQEARDAAIAARDTALGHRNQADSHRIAALGAQAAAELARSAAETAAANALGAASNASGHATTASSAATTATQAAADADADRIAADNARIAAQAAAAAAQTFNPSLYAALAGAAFTGTVTVGGVNVRDAAILNTGTLADARLTGNVALRNAANTFSGTQIVRGAAGLRFEIQNSGDANRGGFLADTGSQFRIGTNSGVRGIEFAPDNVVAGWISAARNWTINAPASGTALNVQGATTLTQRLFFGAGPTLRLSSTNFSYDLRTVDASGSLELARNDGVVATILSINSNRNVTINAPASGTALTVNGVGGVTVALQATNGTLSYDAVAVGFGDLYYTGGPGNVLRVGPRGFTSGGIALCYTNSGGSQFQALAVGPAGNVTVNAPSSGVGVTINALSGSAALRCNGTGGGNLVLLDRTGGTGTALAIIGASRGIEILSGTNTVGDACVAMSGNSAAAEAFSFNSLQATGTAAPVLTANKPGSSTAVATWVRVSYGGVRGWMPIWAD